MHLVSLHERFCQYKSVNECLSPRTIKWHQNLFRSFIQFTPIETIEELSRHVVEDWIFWGHSERNWSPKTIRGSLMALSVFFNWCVKEEIIDYNPVKDIRKPRLPHKIPKHLSLEQVEHLLFCANRFPYVYEYERNRAIAILTMFIYSGLRYKELINLKLTDIDFTQMCIRVYDGKGGKDRVIPISPHLENYLRPYLQEREYLNPYSPYFFVSKTLTGKMSDNVIKRLFAKLKQKSKLHFTAHALRHTFATLMLEGNTDIYTLSELMGHSSIVTTQIYLHATVNHKRAEIVKHPLKHINLSKSTRKTLSRHREVNFSGRYRRVA